MAGTINPDASRIWDEAEVYVIERSAVPGGDISTLIPSSITDDIDPDWEFVGLIDAAAGIPVTPELEIVHYDGFGHARYRSKARKGTISTGFTALEKNSVTRKFVLPGSAPNRIGKPKGVYFYTLYVLRDEETVTDIWVSLRPALFELAAFTKAEGEQESYGITVHHANHPSGDVFEVVSGNNSPTAPAIGTLSPTSVAPAGGAMVQVAGSSFTGATAVTVGGTAATSFTVIDDPSLVFVAPAKTAGTYPVVVTNGVGPSAGKNLTYA